MFVARGVGQHLWAVGPGLLARAIYLGRRERLAGRPSQQRRLHREWLFTANHYPVIDYIVVALYTKHSVVVQNTCSAYEASESTCGQSDCDC